MKKLILSAIMIGSVAAANAQAGSILVFGDLGLGMQKNPAGDKSVQFNIHPGVGYQFNRNWTVGLTGGFGTSSSKLDTAGALWYHDNSYRVAPFVRYTQPVNRIFSIFGQLEAGYKGTSSAWEDAPSAAVARTNGFYASFFPAVGVNVVNGFALNFGFGGIDFSSVTAKGANNATNTFGLTFGQQVNVGISKNFGGRHHKMKGHHDNMRHDSRGEKHDHEESEESED